MITKRSLLTFGGLSLIVMGTCGLRDSARAQEGGYRVSEHPQTTVSEPPTTGGGDRITNATRRLARIEYLSGKVTWRRDAGAAWANATKNLPLQQDAQIWVTEGGRAEIRFDDGSLLRLGDGAIVTLQTFYNDAQGKFTELKMNAGLATLRLTQEHSIYQVETPTVTVKANGQARVRIGVGDTVEVGVREGRAAIEGAPGKTTLVAGDFVALHDASAPYAIQSLPPADSWERWNDERDKKLYADAHPTTTHSHPYPPYGPFTSIFLDFDFPIGGDHYYRGGHWGGHVEHYHRW